MDAVVEESSKEQNTVDEFRTLVLKRDRLKKEEEFVQREYIITFGDLIEKRFTLQIECIKYKKSIQYCQSHINKGETIYADQLATCVEDQLTRYYDQLDNIKAIANNKGESISEYNRLKIKRIYKEIALMIHPDMHPGEEFSSEMMDLWERAKDAYKRNDLQEIKDVKLLVMDLLKKEPLADKDIDEDYLASRISALQKEIQEIINGTPYRYKDILDDDEATEEMRDEFREDIADMEKYLEELKAKFAEFEITEVLN